MMIMEDPVMSYNWRYLQNYVFGLWICLRSWLLIPATYLLAIYCCIVELYQDTFHAISSKERSEEWSHSSLLTQERDEGRIAVLTGADGTIGTEVSHIFHYFCYYSFRSLDYCFSSDSRSLFLDRKDRN